MASDRVRFMQCLECGKDPSKCDAKGKDEDAEGLCRKYEEIKGREQWKAMLEMERKRK